LYSVVFDAAATMGNKKLGDAMDSDQCQAMVRECYRRALLASDPDEQSKFIDLAKKWREMAERIAKADLD
jgi:hypothetical protein